MCQIKQCYAVSNNNERCTNQTENFQYNHCSIHYRTASKLYRKYKEICEIAYNLDVNKIMSNVNEQIKYLNECHEWFVKAYNARMEHREYAIAPECYDYGHNLQFKIIQDKIDYCHDKIVELCKLQEQENKAQEINNFTNKTMDKVENFKKKQKRDDENLEKLMTYYIEKNKVVHQEKKRINNLIAKCITDFLKEYPEHNKFFEQASLFILLVRLESIEYFKDYKPIFCTDCNCGGYIGHSVKMGCRCLLNEEGIITEFVNHTSGTMEQLKCFYHNLLREKEKIKPIVSDFIKYMKIYGTSILDVKMEVMWYELHNRIVLQQFNERRADKESKFLARFRMKKKYQEEQYELDSLLDSDDENEQEKKKSRKEKRKELRSQAKLKRKVNSPQQMIAAN
jgi:hypothetical protein